MKDLDFDELDRAVNSLMTGVPKTPDPKKEEQTLTIPSTPKDAVSAGADVPKEEIGAADSVKPPTTTPARSSASQASGSVASRRGRFMDMVRPNASKPAETSRTPSRQGMTVEPVGPSIADVVPPSVPPKQDVDSAPASAPTTDWPDPLDMAAKNEGDAKQALIDVPHEELLMASNEVSGIGDVSASPTTPFLSDAKVEKRPLGGNSTSSETSLDGIEKPLVDIDSTKKADDTSKSASAQLPADPTEAMHKDLPEELSGDLMAIESGANTAAQANDPDGKAVEKEASPEPVMAAPVKETPEPTNNAPAAPPPDEKPLPTGPISIPQQYKEEPSTGDKESGSIYDTDTYHQPLSHPAKKKSGWMWVIWIVIILLLGAAGGAALYLVGVF